MPETKKFETKYYVKPSNKRLFLHFRSNHPEHTFRSIVYSQALQGIMINSRDDWNIDYLQELREKFLEQDYPLNLINEEYAKALQISRKDLLFNDNRKRKRKVIAPLIITFNPGNPPMKKWIGDEIKILHEDPNLKKIFQKIDVVTRKAENIGQKVIQSRHWKFDRPQNINRPPPPPPGNFKLHSKNCVTCLRIENEKTSFTSSKTGRQYKITRHYTCESTHVIYLAQCTLCNVDYIGQTTRQMRKRHLGHRAEVRAGVDGLGEHFLNTHGVGLNLKDDRIFEDSVMRHFKLTIIASVEPGQPWSLTKLDQLEGDFQKPLMCMDYNGGMNKRDENLRKRRQGR